MADGVGSTTMATYRWGNWVLQMNSSSAPSLTGDPEQSGAQLETTSIREGVEVRKVGGYIFLVSSCTMYHTAALFVVCISPCILPSVHASLDKLLPALAPCFSELFIK